MIILMEVVAELLKGAAKPFGAVTAEILIEFIKKAKNSFGKETAKCMEQNAEKTIEELKKIEISPEMRKEIEQYLMEKKHPEYMYGVDFFFAEKLSETDMEKLKDVLQHANLDREGEEIIDEETAGYQERLDQLLCKYVLCEDINEAAGDYGIKGNDLYINFGDFPDGSDWSYDQEADEDMRGIVEALNYLMEKHIGSNNKIVKYLIF